jgi:hypothetical protein
MANTVIQLKHSTLTGNVPSSLANGEISINSRDGKFFYSTPAGSVITHYPYLGPAGLDTEVQFNDSGTIGGSEKLTFNKTTGQLTVNGTVRANIFSADGVNVYAFAINSFNAANAAFLAANAATATDTTQNNSITAAFVRANNSLDANNGGTVTGTITANSFITTGSYGNITGANTIYANNFVANTGFIQFADGSKQFTANAGSGGGGTTDFGFGIIYTANNNTYANAAAANSQVNFVGESGVVVFANSTTKTITVAGTPGAQGLTVDYGFVYESINYSIDYGTL